MLGIMFPKGVKIGLVNVAEDKMGTTSSRVIIVQRYVKVPHLQHQLFHIPIVNR